MSRLSELFNKPTQSGPVVRSAVDLQAAINALADTIPGLEDKLAEAALAASDLLEDGDAQLVDAEAALASAKARGKALQAALAKAKAREAAVVKQRKYEVASAQGVRVIKLLGQSEKKAAELSASLANSIQLFHDLLSIRAEARIAFPGGYPAQGFYLEPEALLLLLKNEIYRLGGSPFISSAASIAGGPPAFPGGVPETIMLGQSELASIQDRLASSDKGAASIIARTIEALKPAPLQS